MRCQVTASVYSLPAVSRRRKNETDEKSLSDWLITLPKSCGVMAAFDQRAKNVLDACRLAQIAVPEQIAVRGMARSVALACEFIRKNAESHIGINDVVAACGTSKRLLEKNFRAVLNTTAVRELQRGRLECVKKKLEESTLSLSRICESCGFNDESHLKKIFKRTFGMTMSACRKAART